ncbi:MAG: DUF4058 family protein [Planctomycetota bacterium]|nr:DUF4058 family protein [Planctomycetota bacterium]
MNATTQNSPFPGMDPYLEQKWPEVHARLIVYASNQLNSQLPDDLQANIEENLEVRYDDDSSHAIRPDVHVVDESVIVPKGFNTESTIAVAEPLIVPLAPCPDRHVAIVNAAGKVITAIEFLSPWNKLGDKGRSKYIGKQLEYLAAGVSLVEIDLVRRGSYVLAAPEILIPEDFRTPYLVCVYREEDLDQAELYRVPLRERLPNIPVPLRPQEPDAVLQLQALIDECYRDGRYYRTNYNVDPTPPLTGEDVTWADGLLREQGRRN